MVMAVKEMPGKMSPLLFYF